MTQSSRHPSRPALYGSLALTLSLVALSACSTQAPSGMAARAAVGPTSLTVALYPWVPRPEQFQEAITKAWAAVHPEVSIRWVPSSQWDGGYDTEPNPAWDLFVFDAINLDYFRNKGMLLALQPSQVADPTDLLPYAAQGVLSDGLYYGIPQLGCGDILFYNANDAALAAATTMSAVTGALGSCQYYDTQPPSSVGLMLDLSGSTTNATTYVETLHETTNTYPVPLPRTPADLDPTTLTLVRSSIGTSSFYNVYHESKNPYIRADWFNRGAGRAYVGFTESLSELSAPRLQTIAFKPMPWSNNPTGNRNPLFYSDVIGIGSQTTARQTNTLAIELANLMASTNVMVDSIGPWQGQGPQYLLPVRTSVFDELKAAYPTYGQLQAMVSSVHPILFNLGPESKPWLLSMKKSIVSAFKDQPVCYCDKPAGAIFNQPQAEAACPNVCAGTNGWNGQWTTSGGTSFCGCGCGVHQAPSKQVASPNSFH